jgi:hypothetical protein
VTEGRLRTRRNLLRAVRGFLIHAATSTEPEVLEAEFLDAIRDNDDYGLAQWYFRRDGESEEPFHTLQALYREVWDRIAQAV